MNCVEIRKVANGFIVYTDRIGPQYAPGISMSAPETIYVFNDFNEMSKWLNEKFQAPEKDA